MIGDTGPGRVAVGLSSIRHLVKVFQHRGTFIGAKRYPRMSIIYYRSLYTLVKSRLHFVEDDERAHSLSLCRAFSYGAYTLHSSGGGGSRCKVTGLKHGTRFSGVEYAGCSIAVEEASIPIKHA